MVLILKCCPVLRNLVSALDGLLRRAYQLPFLPIQLLEAGFQIESMIEGIEIQGQS